MNHSQKQIFSFRQSRKEGLFAQAADISAMQSPQDEIPQTKRTAEAVLNVWVSGWPLLSGWIRVDSGSEWSDKAGGFGEWLRNLRLRCKSRL